MIIELKRGGAVTIPHNEFEDFALVFSKSIYHRSPELADIDSEKRVGMLRRDVEPTHNENDFVDIAVYSVPGDDVGCYNLVYDGSVNITGWRFAR